MKIRHLHRRDENGNRIQLRFATMLAKKISKSNLTQRIETLYKVSIRFLCLRWLIGAAGFYAYTRSRKSK